ncbi:MAG: hypothetical protein IIZ87_07405, partial [Selenomonas sp.]|nr:hypothetical protein [Selenomonas sp.]
MEEGGTGKGFGLYKMVAESKGADKAKIASVIRKMDYDDFMKTRYWQLVAQQVKHDAGWRCEDCGSRHGLVAHHDDYKRHGFECTTWPNCIAFARPATSGGTALGLNILK